MLLRLRLLLLAGLGTQLLIGQCSCIVINTDLISILSGCLMALRLFPCNSDSGEVAIESFFEVYQKSGWHYNQVGRFGCVAKSFIEKCQVIE